LCARSARASLTFKPDCLDQQNRTLFGTLYDLP
jgi:hypothetical protein